MRILLIDHEGDSLIFSHDLTFRLHTVEHGEWCVEAEIFDDTHAHSSVLSWHETQAEADFVRDALVLEYVRALKIGSPLCMLSAAELEGIRDNMIPCGVCNGNGCPECEPEPDPSEDAWWSSPQDKPGEITKVEITGSSQCMVCQDKGCVVCQGRGKA